MSYDPRKEGAACERCPRQGQAPLEPDGDACRASFAVIGTEPSAQEIRRGGPAEGSAYIRLLKIVAAAYLDKGRTWSPREAWLTYGALCPPVTRHESELRRAITCCRPRLVNELRALGPNARWLTLGKRGYYTVTGKDQGVEGRFGFHEELTFEAFEALAVEALAKKKAKKAKKA